MKAKNLFENVEKKSNNVFEYLDKITLDDINLDILEDFYFELKKNSIRFKVTGKSIFDVCGTGGSGKIRINLSTILALKLKEKFTIAKHSNRASSGKVGSIDVLESMSFKISKSPQEAIKSIENNNIAFLFAPAFHPSLVKFSEIRKKIGRPTIFNFVMPLLNPIENLKGQMIGVSNLRIMKLMSELALRLSKNIIFVHDLDNNLDDVSITGETFIIEVLNGNLIEYKISPEEFNLKRVIHFQEISGYLDVNLNSKLAEEMLNGGANKSYLSFLEINKLIAEGFFNKCL